MTVVTQDIIAAFRHQYGADIVSRTQRMPGQPGQSVSHLAVHQAVAHAWLDLTGEPFRPHHATMLMSMRRKEHVALVAQNPRRTMSLIALAIHTLLEDPHRPALLVVADEAAALEVYRQVSDLLTRLPDPYEIAPVIVSDITGSVEHAHIFIVTYDALHRRLLRFFDRAWRTLWESVGLVALLDIHVLAGLGMAHLAAMLVRVQRILTQYHNIDDLQLVATSRPADGIDEVLRQLQVGSWRHIHADDYGYEPVDVEIWHVPEDFVRVSIQLAQQLSDAGFRTHICMNLALQTLWSDVDIPELMTTSQRLWPADVLVMVGVGDQRHILNEAFTMRYKSIVVLLSAHPLDSWFSQHPDALLSTPKPTWPLVVANAYVLSQHVRAAAYELPLRIDEAEGWGTRELCDRLVERKQMVVLPQTQGWLASATPDPYDDFHLSSAIGLPVLLQVGEVSLDATFDPTGFERWLGEGASVPPWYGGLCVSERAEAEGSVMLHVDMASRRTLPLRDCRVAIRETKATHTIGQGRTMTYGRVLVDEQVIGLHVWHEGKVVDDIYDTPLQSRWSAPACWLDVPECTGEGAQLIGWSLVLSMAMLTVLDGAAVVPCADTELRRLYLVDAQPGGNGAAEWMYAHADQVLQQALSLAELLVADPLLTEGCALDESWLRHYVTGRSSTASQRTTSPLAAIPMPAPVPPTPTPVPLQAEMGWDADADDHQEDDTRPYDHATTSVVMPNPNPATGSEVTAPQRPNPTTGRRRNWSQRPRPNMPGGKAGSADQGAVPPARTPPPSARRTDVPARPPTIPPTSSQRSAPAPRNPAPPTTRGSATPATSAAEAATPNINRIMANLRKQIEERMPHGDRDNRSDGANTRSGTQDVHRFVPGQRIFCLPYGDGQIIDSFFVNGREYIRAEFPNYGELQIDPALSLVRVVAATDQASDDE